MLRNNSIKELKKLLYIDDSVGDIKFKVIWDSFKVGDRVPMEGGITLIVVEKGVNQDGLRYVSLLGEMPKGSGFPKNQHSNATEFFLCIKGLIKETVSSAKMSSGKSFTFRPRAHHGFKALKASEFFCVMTENK